MKYLAAAAALAPLTVLEGAQSYGLARTLLRRPMVVWSPSALFPDEAWPKPDFPSVSPKYEITDTQEKFQIAIDVPGVKAEDINVSLENDGQVLTVSGEREEAKENYKYSSKFSQSFGLDPAIIADQFTANLSDGVLVVSAPKELKKLEEAPVQKIPITQNKHTEEVTVEKKEEVKEEQTA